jgi:NhaP-type Na+/H+ or K+/H+ antiporter
MSKKSSAQQDGERRAEARRRARLQAQGRLEGEWEEQDEVEAATSARPSASLIQRLFPPAAPLPGKPDPLAGFTYTGRLRPVVSSLWLIPRNLFAGVLMGILWAAAYIITIQYARSMVGSIASFASFGALVAAGWIGWQRPWLYGFVAAVIGYVLYTIYVIIALAGNPALNEPGATTQAALFLLTNGVLQAGIGALAGFYGGYLRRRMADPTARQRSAARRRR